MRTTKLLLIIATSLTMTLAAVGLIIACVGSPQPPLCLTLKNRVLQGQAKLNELDAKRKNREAFLKLVKPKEKK